MWINTNDTEFLKGFMKNQQGNYRSIQQIKKILKQNKNLNTKEQLSKLPKDKILWWGVNQ